MEVRTNQLLPREWHADPPVVQTMWGDRQLVALAIGPGGGWRYWYEIVEETGVVLIASKEYSKQLADVLIAAEPGWRMVWLVGWDLIIMSVYVADSRGVHQHELDTERSREEYQSHPLVGQEPLTKTELIELFAGITVPKRVADIPARK